MTFYLKYVKVITEWGPNPGPGVKANRILSVCPFRSSVLAAHPQVAPFEDLAARPCDDSSNHCVPVPLPPRAPVLIRRKRDSSPLSSSSPHLAVGFSYLPERKQPGVGTLDSALPAAPASHPGDLATSIPLALAMVRRAVSDFISGTRVHWEHTHSTKSVSA